MLVHPAFLFVVTLEKIDVNQEMCYKTCFSIWMRLLF